MRTRVSGFFMCVIVLMLAASLAEARPTKRKTRGRRHSTVTTQTAPVTEQHVHQESGERQSCCVKCGCPVMFENCEHSCHEIPADEKILVPKGVMELPMGLEFVAEINRQFKRASEIIDTQCVALCAKKAENETAAQSAAKEKAKPKTVRRHRH